MEGRNRKKQLLIYLSEDESKILEFKMRRSGFDNKSAFIRALIRYGKAFKIDYKFLHEYSVQISKIGNNINQIAYKVNSTDCLSYEEYLTLRKDMEKIWQLQKSILSLIPLIEL